MTRPAPLERLSDISKQRSIRRPLLVPVPEDGFADGSKAPRTIVHWPIPR
jgi:hypothetical protein